MFIIGNQYGTPKYFCNGNSFSSFPDMLSDSDNGRGKGVDKEF